MKDLKSIVEGYKLPSQTTHKSILTTGVASIDENAIDDIAIDDTAVFKGGFRKTLTEYRALGREINRVPKSIRIVNNTAYIVDGVLTLPEEITKLVNNDRYLNKYYKLARAWGVDYLLQLARIAKTKAKPTNYYNKCTSLNIDKTTGEVCRKMTVKMLDDLNDRIDKAKNWVKNNLKDWDNNYLYWLVKGMKKLSEYELNNLATDIHREHIKSPLGLLIYTVQQRLKPPELV
jgi:hypothetical protein